MTMGQCHSSIVQGEVLVQVGLLNLAPYNWMVFDRLVPYYHVDRDEAIQNSIKLREKSFCVLCWHHAYSGYDQFSCVRESRL
jgi:hypothetical protein